MPSSEEGLATLGGFRCKKGAFVALDTEITYVSYSNSQLSPES